MRRAITLDTNDADLYGFLGVLLHRQQRLDEAESAYRQAIELDHDNATVYSNLGLLLRKGGRLAEAAAVYEMAFQARNDFHSSIVLARIHKQLGHDAEAGRYVTHARAFLSPDDDYNAACLESISGNVDAAFDRLRGAAERADFDPEEAYRDSDLELLRADPRFEEIVGPPASGWPPV